jgi:hypothetical protein
LEPTITPSSSDLDNDGGPPADPTDATSDNDSILSDETHIPQDDAPSLNHPDGYAEILAAGMCRLECNPRMHV